MTTIANIFAAIGIFFGSLFGSSPSPVAEVPTPTPIVASSSNTSVADSITKTVPQGYHIGTSTIWFLDRDKPLPGVDLSTFTAFPGGQVQFGVDTTQAYCGGSVVAGADPATFVAIIGVEDHTAYATGYAKDKNHVYAGCDGIIPSADPATFVVLDNYVQDGGYVKDATHVWFSRAPGASMATDPWGFSADLVVGADPATFESDFTGSHDGIDKNHSYLEGKTVQ